MHSMFREHDLQLDSRQLRRSIYERERKAIILTIRIEAQLLLYEIEKKIKSWYFT